MCGSILIRLKKQYINYFKPGRKAKGSFERAVPVEGFMDDASESSASTGMITCLLDNRLWTIDDPISTTSPPRNRLFSIGSCTVVRGPSSQASPA